MSLELEIKALREAVEANTAALTGGESSGKTTAKTTTRKTTAKKATTVDQLAKVVGAYLTEGDKADKTKAKKNVTKIVEHFDAERVSLIDPEHFDEVLQMVESFKNGDDPIGGEEEGDDGASLM